MKKIKKVIYYLASTLLALPFVVIAAPSIPSAGSVNTADELYKKLVSILDYVFGLALALGIGYIIWGGIGWMTAGGDDEKLTTARKNLLYGLIGILIITGVWTLIRIVTSFFGLGNVSL
ncbi:MAG: hypothetical protein ISS02_01055 [Candidatus Portnoybacteria bacterium]|nr:hypothetical protein [Candidatus Portnoybacteria bacterium]